MMKPDEIIKKKIAEAEKKILGLIDSGDLKNISKSEKYKISEFYEMKSKNRLESLNQKLLLKIWYLIKLF